MGNHIITISREFGSGGHFIGEEVAKKLGIPFYDKEILEKISEKTGLSRAFIEKQGEYSPGTHIFSYGFVGRDATGSSVSDKIYEVQSKIIRELAEKGPCVIIGRCADFILSDEKDARHIFIYGNQKTKQERIMRLYQKTEKEALELMRSMDKKRKVHYDYYTDQVWGAKENYTMTLNSSILGYDTCVELIVSCAKK